MSLITVETMMEAGLDEAVAQGLLAQIGSDLEAAREEGISLMRGEVEALTKRITELEGQARERDLVALLERFGLKGGVVHEMILDQLKDPQVDAEAYLTELKEIEPMLFEGEAYPRFAGALEQGAEGSMEALPLHFLRMPHARKAGGA